MVTKPLSRAGNVRVILPLVVGEAVKAPDGTEAFTDALDSLRTLLDDMQPESESLNQKVDVQVPPATRSLPNRDMSPVVNFTKTQPSGFSPGGGG